jgi:CxxH/CxxC protein (TIGR04129 family)
VIKCCGEHVDIAIEIIVDEYEIAPKIDKISEDELSTSCEYCLNTAMYVVSN